MSIPFIGQSANEVIFRRHGISNTANYGMWALYSAIGLAAGLAADRIHKFAPLAITGALVLAEVVSSRPLYIPSDKHLAFGRGPMYHVSVLMTHVTAFGVSKLGFALPFARGFALTTLITGFKAVSPDVMSAITNRAIDGASALQIAKKAAPMLLGFATFGRTYSGFTLHGDRNQSFGLRLSYALDLYRKAPKKQAKSQETDVLGLDAQF